MKKLLLSLIAVAGAWTSAFALDGYVTHTQDVTMTLNRADLNHVTSNQFVYTNDNYGKFTLAGDKNIEYLSGDDKCLNLNRGTSFGFKWENSSNFYYISKLTSFTIKTAVNTAGKVSLNHEDTHNIGTISVDKSSDKVYTTVTTQNEQGLPNPISIVYSDLYNGLFNKPNQYICYISYNYQVEYYTLDFTKANNLMSQAQALYDGLSEDTKGSNAGVALHNAMEAITAFKSANDNDNPVDITGPLRGNLTTLENKLDAAIKAFVKLDFTNANNLMSQADALYNGLSEESKSSAAGQELLNSKNTAATFKAAHENENLDKESSLFTELTNKENAIQAAIDAFTCNLADTDEQYTVNNKTVTNVKLTRTIKAGTWNTLCLPFDMEIPAGWTVKELSGVSYNSVADSYDAQFSTASSIVAGKPYIVKVSTEVPEITRNDAAGFKLAAAPTSVEVFDNGGTLTFTGVFAPKDLANCYFISGGKFYYATPGKGNTTKAYRALFTIGGASSSAKLVYTVDGDEVTLIDAPELVPANDAPVFDLQGRRVNAPVSGKLYIKNGKKFVQQ